MNFSSVLLQQARKTGQTDDQIYDYLATRDERFRAAKTAGLTLDAVAAHFDKKDVTPAPPQPSPQVPAPSDTSLIPTTVVEPLPKFTTAAPTSTAVSPTYRETAPLGRDIGSYVATRAKAVPQGVSQSVGLMGSAMKLAGTLADEPPQVEKAAKEGASILQRYGIDASYLNEHGGLSGPKMKKLGEETGHEFSVKERVQIFEALNKQFGGPKEASVVSTFLKDAGDAVKDYADKAADFYSVPDPDLVTKIGNMVGGSAVYIVPGLGATRVATMAGLAPSLAAWFGAGATGVVQAGAEAGRVYEEAKAKGMSETEAEQAGYDVFYKDAAWLTVTGRLGGVFGPMKGVLKRTYSEAGMGAVQNGVQQVFENIALQDPTFRNVPEAAAIGAVATLPFAAARGVGEVVPGKGNEWKQRDVSQMTRQERQDVLARQGVEMLAEGTQPASEALRRGPLTKAVEEMPQEEVAELLKGTSAGGRAQGIAVPKPVPPEILDRGLAKLREFPEVKSPEQQEKLAGLAFDPLLGEWKVSSFPEVDKAMSEMDAAGIPFTVVSTDGGNLGGLNKAYPIRDQADAYVKQVWGEVYAAELQKNGVLLGRSQGDEFREVWPNRTPEEVETIRGDIEQKMRARAAELGLAKISHPKEGYGGMETGALYTQYGVAGHEPGKHGDAMREADENLQVMKKIFKIDKAKKLGYIYDKETGNVTGKLESQNGPSGQRQRQGGVGTSGAERQQSAGAPTRQGSTGGTPSTAAGARTRTARKPTRVEERAAAERVAAATAPNPAAGEVPTAYQAALGRSAPKVRTAAEIALQRATETERTAPTAAETAEGPAASTPEEPAASPTGPDQTGPGAAEATPQGQKPRKTIESLAEAGKTERELYEPSERFYRPQGHAETDAKAQANFDRLGPLGSYESVLIDGKPTAETVALAGKVADHYRKQAMDAQAKGNVAMFTENMMKHKRTVATIAERLTEQGRGIDAVKLMLQSPEGAQYYAQRKSQRVLEQIDEGKQRKWDVKFQQLKKALDTAKTDEEARAAINRLFGSKATHKNPALTEELLAVRQMKANDEVVKAVAGKLLGLPTVTLEFSRRIAEAVDKINQLPAGSRARQWAQDELNAMFVQLNKPSFWRSVSTWMRIAPLAGTRTQSRNIISAVALGNVERLNTVVASMLDAARSGLTGGKRQLTFRTGSDLAKEVTAGGKEYFEALPYGLKAGWRGIEPGGAPNQLETQGLHLQKVPVMRTIEKVVGASMKGFDYAAYQSSLLTALKECGYLEAKGKGLKGKELDAYIAEYIKNVPETAREFAEKYASRIRLTDKNAISDLFLGVRKLINKIPGLGTPGGEVGLGDVIALYAQGPGSLLNQAIDYSPLGFVRSAIEAKKALATRDYRDLELGLARALIGGVGFTGLGAVAYLLGIITGPPTKDKEARQFMREETGEIGYQINLGALGRVTGALGMGKVDAIEQAAQKQPGDRLYSWDWLQPFAVSVAMGTVMAKHAQQGQFNPVEAVGGGVQTIFEQPLLTGVKRVLMQDYSRDQANKFARIVENVPGLFIPTFVNDLRKLSDPTVREVYHPNPLQRTANRIINRIPFWERVLPETAKVFGKGAAKYFDSDETDLFTYLLSPGFTAKYKVDPLLSVVMNPWETDERSKQFPPVQAFMTSYNENEVRKWLRLKPDEVKTSGDLINEKGLRKVGNQYVTQLTGKEISELQKYMAESMEASFTRILPDLQSAQPAQQEKAMGRMVSRVTENAKRQLIRYRTGQITTLLQDAPSFASPDEAQEVDEEGTSDVTSTEE